MKRWVVIVLLLLVLTACNRSACPAYQDGAVTGTEGSPGKTQGLFPKEMNRKR